MRRLPRRHFLRAASALGAAALFGGRSVRASPARRQRVLVAGAGLAGLSAAWGLMQRGHDVTVFEAQQRVGGRVLTERASFADGLYAELGATRIPNYHWLTLRTVEALGLPLERVPTGLPTIYHVGGKRLRYEEGARVEWPLPLSADERARSPAAHKEHLMQRGLALVGDLSAPGWPPPAAQALDAISFSEYLRREGASEAWLQLLRASSGSDLDDFSALMWLSWERLDLQWTQLFKLRGGNDQLPRALAQRLGERVVRGAEVKAVQQTPGGVTVHVVTPAGPHRLEADRFVCALPLPRVLQLDVEPALPAPRREALAALRYAPCARTAVQVRRRLWHDEGVGGLQIGNSDGVLERVWDMSVTQPGTRGVVLAYAEGRHARALGALAPAARLPFVVRELDALFPGMGALAEGGVARCWEEDPFALGAWPEVGPGQGLGALQMVGRAEGRLHFAGEHTSPWLGWMQGALESGERVVAEVEAAGP